MKVARSLKGADLDMIFHGSRSGEASKHVRLRASSDLFGNIAAFRGMRLTKTMLPIFQRD